MWSGFVALAVGAIWFIIAAFQESLLTGLAVLFLPIVWLVFLVLCWDRAKRPFALQVSGVCFILLGVMACTAPLPWH